MACEVNQIFLGEIASVQNYGAFIRIPGCKQQGLIHRSQISSAHVEDVNEVLQRGERVWCKVISIAEDGKIGLSMKFVNQGNGKDLDPNGVQMHLDEQRRKKMGNKEDRKAIVLDAVYKTTCSKCKTPGHLAKDCFSTPDGKKYELLPEEDEKPIFKPQEQVENKNKSKEKKHKLKKSKKRKRSKSSKRDTSDSEDSDSSDEKTKKKKKKSKKDTSDSEDSDSSDEKTKKKKKKSKEQKHKKKKRRDSSSDSDSSDSSEPSFENKKHSKKCKHSRTRHLD